MEMAAKGLVGAGLFLATVLRQTRPFLANPLCNQLETRPYSGLQTALFFHQEYFK
jgi:hypothetical protein